MKILYNSQGIYSTFGDGVTTGFSKAGATTAKYLAKTFDVSYVAHDYTGLSFENEGYTVHRGNADYSAQEINQHILRYDYDVLLYLGEPWGAQNYKHIDFGDCKTIIHVPTDGLPLDSYLSAVKDDFDLIVPMSKFGKLTLESADIDCAESIPLSFNSKYYKPLSEPKFRTVREELELEDKFVVNFVGRQQERKNLMSMIVAYSKFAVDKSDVVLLLTITIDNHADFELLQLIQMLGIGDKVKIIQMNHGNMLSDEELASIYSVSDVYLSTSCSEGFDMPVLESIACGTPAIVSKYSAHIELVTGHGELIDIEYYKSLSNNTNWGYVSIGDTMAKLNTVYGDRELLAKYSKDGVEFASQYKDSIIQPMWTDLMNNLEDTIEEIENSKPIRSMRL